MVHYATASIYTRELQAATTNLPRRVASWMSRALRAGWLPIQGGAYDEPGGGACPIVAGAVMAGAWADGHLLPGHPEWGGPDGPTEAVEEFAAYFDLCSEELGAKLAIRLVREVLDELLLSGGGHVDQAAKPA